MKTPPELTPREENTALTFRALGADSFAFTGCDGVSRQIVLKGETIWNLRRWAIACGMGKIPSWDFLVMLIGSSVYEDGRCLDMDDVTRIMPKAAEDKAYIIKETGTRFERMLKRHNAQMPPTGLN